MNIDTLLTGIIRVLKRVRKRVMESLESGEGRKVVGLGASGDSTLIVDKVAEDGIRKGLMDLLKDFYLLSEEAGFIKVGSNPSLYLVVDPIHGSTNLSRGIPFSSISIAVSKTPSLQGLIAGVVANLYSEDTYWCIRGKGSFKNGEQIHVSHTSSLKEAVLTVVVNERRTPGGLNAVKPLFGKTKSVRLLGSVALELCYLAEGKIDAVVVPPNHVRNVDALAGIIIASEAGATCVYTGDETKLTKIEKLGFIAASTKPLLDEIISLTNFPQRKTFNPPK